MFADKLDKSLMIEINKSQENLQYIFTFKDFISMEDKQIIREQMENIDESCVAFIDPIMFKSAKLINKKTGQAIDLLQ